MRSSIMVAATLSAVSFAGGAFGGGGGLFFFLFATKKDSPVARNKI
jgi:hypothetical protein